MERLITCKDVAYLCNCAVNDDKPDSNRIAAMNLNAVLLFANAHLITATVTLALESAGCRDDRFHKALAAAQRKTVIFDNALVSVKDSLKEKNIWFMPLKGAILKDYYPKFGMREFADYDILIDASRAADVKEIMLNLGYISKYDIIGVGNHDIYYRPPVLNFEMHRSLFGSKSEKKLQGYYKNVKSKLEGEGCEKHFTTDDFYVYMIAHEYNHYVLKGTGLRSLLDTYVYLNKVSVDMEYVSTETEKLGISDFEKRNRSLAFHLFSGESLSADDREMLKYMLSSGTFGTFENGVKNAISRKGRIGFFLSKLFLPYNMMIVNYPILRKNPVMYPFCNLHRLVSGFFRKRYKFMYQLNALIRPGKKNGDSSTQGRGEISETEGDDVSALQETV